MKRKIICIVMASILILSAAGFGIYYFSPTTFLNGHSPQDVGCIVVFNGSTGIRFTISDVTEVETVVENLKSVTAKRDGISVNYDGFAYQLTIMDAKGKTVDTLIVNGADSLRRDPFFYEITNGSLCYELLHTLEIKYGHNTDSGLHSGDLDNGNRWFEGTVKSVNSNSIQVIPHADTWEAQSGGTVGITVTLRLTDGTTATAPQKGDQVRIIYNGQIAESYPPQILKVESVEILF